MIVFSPALLLAFVIMLCGMWAVRAATAPLRDPANALSADEAAEYRALVEAKTNVGDLPAKYRTHALATKSVMKIYFIVAAAWFLTIVLTVFLGLGLGLVDT